jgi:hypothetical protein
MAAGLSSVNQAHAWLNIMRGGGNGVAFTPPATLFVQLHTSAGDPGASGTANVSTAGSRQALTFNAAASNQITILGTTSWTNWTGTNGEIVAWISVWSASTAGTFYFSAALTANKTVNTGDTLTLSTLTVGLAPIAA